MRARNVLHLLLALALLFSLSAVVVSAAPAQTPLQPPANPSGILGPFTSEPIYPYVWNGDLRDLPQAGVTEEGSTPHTMPFRLTPAEMRAIEAKSPQQAANLKNLGGEDPAPPPIANFAGMNFNANGAGWPPDTNGDVGPNHYIQTVNTSVGIYNKSTGAAISTVTFNTFFAGPAGTPCDTSNQGDPVVLYDPTVNRWIVTNFAWFNATSGPFYECIAVSQTGDPVAGGWYFYALQADRKSVV